MQKIGKFTIKNKERVVYELNGKYYYRTKDGKVYIKKPKDYSKKYSKYKYNRGSKSKSFDVYLDKNPKDTISIKYKTVSDVKQTIRKLEKLYKSGKYSHKRIWQVGMIMYVRLRAMKGKQTQKKLSKKYFKFLGQRTKIKGKSKEETFKKRRSKIFKF
tara:strand:+ start:230 stop:703 length:474 start_codon:yes stop_codon:yes gene_type:complete